LAVIDVDEFMTLKVCGKASSLHSMIPSSVEVILSPSSLRRMAQASCRT
jgi:hypothetical protein